jgi:hypothetical protein
MGAVFGDEEETSDQREPDQDELEARAPWRAVVSHALGQW